MSSLFDVLSGLQAAVTASTSGIIVGGRPVKVEAAIGWPPETKIQSIPRLNSDGTPLAVIGIYDRKVGKNSTRWSPFSYDPILVPATITSVVSLGSMPPLGSSTITLGTQPATTVTQGDAVSAVFTNFALQPRFMAASVAIAPTTDETPATMATRLAGLINSDPLISTWAHAVAVGAAVNITSLVAQDVLNLASYVGNGGYQTTELGRRERQLQILCWTPTEEIRAAISDPIDVMIAAGEIDFGFLTQDGTPIRMCSSLDSYDENDTLADLYRRDFLITVDYPVTNIDQLYSIVAPIVNYPAQ